MNSSVELPWYAKLTFILGALTLIVFFLIQASSILIPFLFAVFFAILLTPLSSFLEKYRIHRVFSSLLSLFIGITFLSGVIFFFYNQIVNFAQDLGMIEERINELFEQFSGFFNVYLDVEPDAQLESAQDAIISFLRDNVEPLTRGVMTAATTLTMFFLIPIYVFLLLMYRDFLKDFFLMVFSRSSRNQKVELVLNKVRSVVQNYITGMFIVICILAVLNSLALTIIGVDHPLFFGVFAAILNVIPFLGPIIGSILPIVYSLLTMDSLWYPVAVLATFYVIQLFESNLFTPMIVGQRVSLNPLVTLLAIFIGGQIWGLAGMILFIPGLAMLKEVFDEVDSMRPYGFLLGKVKTREQTEKEYFSGRFPGFSKAESPEDDGEAGREGEGNGRKAGKKSDGKGRTRSREKSR
ncbi:AI-2E family transporter [Balneolales bacterium ANBcel1]|nr:AI-2E family transporter [Balneolales bacterium ANBcel1]